MAGVQLNGSHIEKGAFQEEEKLEPIAIVGLDLQFPGGATDIQSFWDLLSSARCVSQDFPVDRINIQGDPSSDTPNHVNIPVKGGHFLADDVTAFDAPFFSISATEAASMDPQQRMLLESTYRALENGGVPLSRVSGSKTSVFVGCFTDDYKTLYQKDLHDDAPYAATGITTTMNANRISWFFNLLGTSVNVDTACSSSLVALDLACESLRSGSCNMSIAGGASLLLAPDLYHILSGMNMLSAQSRSRSFDSRGDGYGRGEGIGILVLKRLETALNDGDTIRAVIRSTASNQNGYINGITQPSGAAQKALIDDCYEKAGLDKSRTAYVEAHGTGTPAGDPIEANALGSAFRESRLPGEVLYVGSVKSNIGHLEGSSGIAGVIKAVAILENGIIPGISDLQSINPKIDEEYLRLKFPVTAIPWPRPGLRRVSVNSFGFGGSNAHAILDDAYHFLAERNMDGIVFSSKMPRPIGSAPCKVEEQNLTMPSLVKSHPPSDSIQGASGECFRLLPISAADRDGIRRAAEQYSRHFKTQTVKSTDMDRYLDALGYTLVERRTHLPWRAFAILGPGSSLPSFQSLVSAPCKASLNPKIAFVFTGQGAQWPGMGRELLVYDIFRDSLLRAEAFLQSLGCEFQLIAELLKPVGQSRINEPLYSQSICTAIQIALVDLLKFFGVHPSAVIGHSSGEIAAAYCFGAISRSSAWKIAYTRGVLASTLRADSNRQGAMMAVGASSERILDLLGDSSSITIACYNSPSSITVAGDMSSIDNFKAKLDGHKIFARKLKTGVAYHSQQMEAIADAYLDLIGKIEIGEKPPSSPIMISTVLGQRVSTESVRSPHYWVKNMVSPVRFAHGFERLCAKRIAKKLDGSHRSLLNIDIGLEIGPHSALSGPIRDIVSAKGKTMKYLSALKRNSCGVTSMLGAVGQLWCLGAFRNLNRVNNLGESKGPNGVPLCDLPPYPFDHSKSYFHESRVSRNHRLKTRPKILLLGEADLDWNPLEARWSNFLRIPEFPWIADHKINGTVLFPAAGMIVMAIEAIKQLIPREQTVVGYELCNINFRTALTVTPTERGVETQLLLRQNRKFLSRGQGWSEFRLCALLNNEWEEICDGQIRAGYGVQGTGASIGCAESDHIRDIQENFSRVEQKCQTNINVEEFYAALRDCGLDFGPTFKKIKSARYFGAESIAEVKVHGVSPEENESQFVVHPCTLDGLIHTPMVPYTQGGTVASSTLIPSRIQRLWISSTGLNCPTEQPVVAMVNLVASDSRGIDLQVKAMSSDYSKAVMELDGARMTIVDRVSDPLDKPIENDTAWNLVWRPDIEMMSMGEINHYLGVNKRKHEGDPIEFYRRLAFIHFTSLAQAVRELSEETISHDSAPHLAKYLNWAQDQLQNQRLRCLPYWEPEWERLSKDYKHVQNEAKWLESASAEGNAHVAVFRNLLPILRLEIDPLDLLFGSTLLDDFYAEISSTTKYSASLYKYLRLYSHKYPGANYLEIGAGTGGSTTPILNTLATNDNASPVYPAYKSYTFTDISEGFFKAAKTKYRKFPGLIFQPLDIEEPAGRQGFSENSYDVIVAANVLHATKDLSATISNVHYLLRPGGKLILCEITNPSLGRSGFIMGLLAGWWLSTEPTRNNGPCITTKDWHKLLQMHGFSGVDHEFRDWHDDGCHELSWLISSKPRPVETIPNQLHLNIISGSTVSDAGDLLDTLQQQLLNQTGVGGSVMKLHELQASASPTESSAESVTLFAGELCHPYLRTLNDSKFQELQQMLQHCKHLVWLTRSVNNGSSTPDFDMASGLVRVCHSEFENRKFMKVALDPSGEISHRKVQFLLHAIKQMTACSPGAYEMEFEEQDGLFNICRLQSDGSCEEAIHQRLSPAVTQDLCWKDTRPLALVAETPGLLDSLHFVEDDVFPRPLMDNDIEIKVHAAGLNFKDCLMALGRVPGTNLGYECSGVVTRIGSACQRQFRAGDRVSMSTTGAFKTYARSTSAQVCHLPSNISFVDAAAIPTQFVTAWTCINDLARLQKGESVLIHAGAGGTGQAAIQISQHMGAQVFVTVGSPEKRDLLMEEYGLPMDHIFYSRDTSFAKGIKHATNGRGVDVVLNSLAGESLLASWDCVAPYGRFIEIGKKDILDNSSLPMLQFNKCATFSAFDGSKWMIERPADAERNIKIVMEMFEHNILHVAKPLNVYNVAEIQKAFSVLADGKMVGKAVIEMTPTAIVRTTLSATLGYTLASHGSYIIAGGFGGIGRATALWMVERGARNLLLLSRSGPCTPEASRLLKMLRNMGVNVQCPACDIGDKVLLRDVLEKYAEKMPPIRGCIQASMVLQDILLDQMEFRQWKAAVNPKVEGSWNLHELLPKKMDFFVMLSSISGIGGQRGQSNYAAGNTFQDALAHYRVARGEKAVSIDLGAMVDDGYVAGNKQIKERLLGAGAMLPISREKFIALLEYYCDPSLGLLSLDACQVVFGLNTPQNIQAQGLIEPEWYQRPIFGPVHCVPANSRNIDAEGGKSNQLQESRADFIQASSLGQASSIVSNALVGKLQRSLSSMAESEVDFSKPIVNYGVDSLLAVEIKSWISRTFQANIPTFEILGGTNFTTMGAMVANRSLLKKPEWF